MRVITVCEHLMSSQRSPGHWKAFKFVRAIKLEDFSGYADVPIVGRSRRLTMDNRDDALDWAGELLAPHVKAAFPVQPISIVPIPSSSAVSAAHVTNSRGFRIASAIASYAKKGPADALLCWDRVMKKSHQGGSRDPAVLAARHIVTKRPPAGLLAKVRGIVLFDDVLTTSGHFRAAAAVLRHAGYRVCDTAFAVARTVWPDDDNDFGGSSRVPTDDAFGVASEPVEDFIWP